MKKRQMSVGGRSSSFNVEMVGKAVVEALGGSGGQSSICFDFVSLGTINFYGLFFRGGNRRYTVDCH